MAIKLERNREPGQKQNFISNSKSVNIVYVDKNVQPQNPTIILSTWGKIQFAEFSDNVKSYLSSSEEKSDSKITE